MACNDKQKKKCLRVVYASCVEFQETPPEFSDLHDQECLNIEQVALDLYDIIGQVKEDLDLTELDSECLTITQEVKPKELFQILISEICTQKSLIETMQETIATMQEQIQSLQENNCP